MVDYQPKFKPGREVTGTASSDVTAGRVLQVSGNSSVEHASVFSPRVIGVAMFDAKAGELVTWQSLGIHRLIASGTINPGDRVAAAADGKVSSTDDGTGRIGIAYAGALDGAIALIKLDF